MSPAVVLRRWFEAVSGRRWAVSALVPAAVVFAAGVLTAVCTMWPVDLEVYRHGAQALAHGQDVYGTLPPTRAGMVLPFIYPPFAAVAFLALAVPPTPVAAVLMLGISLTALGTTVYVVIRPHTRRRAAVLASVVAGAAALAFEPVRETLWFGQVNLVLMALVVVDCLGPKTRLPRGVLVGLAAAVKITPAGFLLFFLLRRDFRAAGTTVATFLAAGLLGFAVAPRASAAYWFGGGLTGASGMSGSIFATNQTIQGAVNRFGLPHATALVLIAVATLAALLLAAAAMRRTDAPTAFLLNAAAVLVCSPISWSHHWVWIVPATVLFAARATSRTAVAGLAAIVAVFVVAPHSLLPHQDFRELSWGPLEQLAGNSYLLLALGFLAWHFAGRRREART
ncbi:glycosyltransferase 87 family protein [Amycolatopsis jiangsuensis]|uniref:Alpha-1,2-mannosyltransferase n=1 Tax=Amycolatopsis jiangsuensis TaxID=1181879 RepID=A0A840INY9_9PSEU|nr:glycosyltransferase 87 family protein [Amycolatopsis jiangsuensis]MBB4682784.1 alpha-1,2-mannosyltransferase [Amycolatopsis jiangsuensis]